MFTLQTRQPMNSLECKVNTASFKHALISGYDRSNRLKFKSQ